MPFKILFKYTSRSRPALFFRGLNSIVDNLYDKENYFILCTFDEDDTTMNNYEVKNKLNSYKNIAYYFGTHTGKIDAINADLDKLPYFDILVNMSDDFIFTQINFDILIREAMKRRFPDTDGWLHFHDGNQERLATMSIIGEKYFRRFNYIYHNSYKTIWCDNEEQIKAQKLGKYVYIEKPHIMKHLNPWHGHKEAMDDLYKNNAVYSKADKENFHKRQAHNFDL